MRPSTEKDSAIPTDESRWEWPLPKGRRIAATLDASGTVESVFVDGRLVSRAPRGTKRDGHIISLNASSNASQRNASDSDAPGDVVVTFDPRVMVCILRVGREEIAPAQWPLPKRKEAAAPERPIPLGSIVAFIGIIAFAGGAFFAWRLATATNETNAGALSAKHRAASGLFVAHFPERFTARPADVPSGMSGLVLEDRMKAEAIVIIALEAPPGLRDPWDIQQRVHGEARALAPRGDGSYAELSRSDATCHGERGAMIIDRITGPRGTPATLWSCAFVHDGIAYLFMTSLPEGASADVAAEQRRVVDATELTRLEPLGKEKLELGKEKLELP